MVDTTLDENNRNTEWLWGLEFIDLRACLI